MLLEQYQDAEAALLEGLSLEPRHEGMLATMATVTMALEPDEPASPTSPAASTPKRSAPSLPDLKQVWGVCTGCALRSRACDEANACKERLPLAVSSVTDTRRSHYDDEPSFGMFPCVDHPDRRFAVLGRWTARRTTWSASCA